MPKKKLFAIIFSVAMTFLFLSGCAKDSIDALPRPDIPVAVLDNVPEEVQFDGANSQKDSDTAAPYYNSYNVVMEVNPVSNKVSLIEKITYKNQTAKELDVLYVKLNIAAFARGYTPVPFFENYRRKVYSYGVNYANYSINSLTINGEEAKYRISARDIAINLPGKLKVDETIELTLQMDAVIPKICHRIGANDSAMWLGNFIPQVAAYRDGAFVIDNYYPAGDPFVSSVANFDVTVMTPLDYDVIGTGLKKETEDQANRTTRFTTNMVRDFALAIGNKYKTVSATAKSGVTVNFTYFSNLQNVDTILKNAVEALDFFADKIGDYPYMQLDLVETELAYGGGMEYPCVIFLDSDYLKKPGNLNSIGHEVAHQWFYGVVGSNQIKEAWLDEGLTTYLQMYLQNKEADVNSIMTEMYKDVADKLKYSDTYKLSDDLSVYKNWSSYYDVQYRRGALMFHALYKKMGKDAFYEFLRAYYTEYSFKSATSKNLMDTASNLYGSDLSDFFNAWITWRELPE